MRAFIRDTTELCRAVADRAAHKSRQHEIERAAARLIEQRRRNEERLEAERLRIAAAMRREAEETRLAQERLEQAIDAKAAELAAKQVAEVEAAAHQRSRAALAAQVRAGNLVSARADVIVAPLEVSGVNTASPVYAICTMAPSPALLRRCGVQGSQCHALATASAALAKLPSTAPLSTVASTTSKEVSGGCAKFFESRDVLAAGARPRRGVFTARVPLSSATLQHLRSQAALVAVFSWPPDAPHLRTASRQSPGTGPRATLLGYALIPTEPALHGRDPQSGRPTISWVPLLRPGASGSCVEVGAIKVGVAIRRLSPSAPSTLPPALPEPSAARSPPSLHPEWFANRKLVIRITELINAFASSPSSGRSLIPAAAAAATTASLPPTQVTSLYLSISVSLLPVGCLDLSNADASVESVPIPVPLGAHPNSPPRLLKITDGEAHLSLQLVSPRILQLWAKSYPHEAKLVSSPTDAQAASPSVIAFALASLHAVATLSISCSQQQPPSASDGETAQTSVPSPVQPHRRILSSAAIPLDALAFFAPSTHPGSALPGVYHLVDPSCGPEIDAGQLVLSLAIEPPVTGPIRPVAPRPAPRITSQAASFPAAYMLSRPLGADIDIDTVTEFRSYPDGPTLSKHNEFARAVSGLDDLATELAAKLPSHQKRAADRAMFLSSRAHAEMPSPTHSPETPRPMDTLTFNQTHFLGGRDTNLPSPASDSAF
jgi:hypothetical protein